MAASAEASALDIQLHPLVVLSLADHYTRERYAPPKAKAAAAGSSAAATSEQASPPPRCMGLLFGQQSGREVHILETVEMAYRVDERGQPVLELEALEVDMQLFSEAYANYECLGWYSSGSQILPHDYQLQKQLTKYNERPLYLMMDPAASNGRALPLTLYEERTHVVADQTSSEFVPVDFTVQADEAERITVTYCAKVVNQEESGSAVVSHYATLLKSVESLKSRVRALHAFLLDVQSGKIQPHANSAQHQQLLRDIKGLCQRLPLMNQESFRSDLLAEYNDALLVTYLSSMTKGSQLLSDVQSKHAMAYEREDPRMEGPMAGLGMMRGRRGMDEEMMGGGGGRGPRSQRGFMSSLMGDFGFNMHA